MNRRANELERVVGRIGTLKVIVSCGTASPGGLVFIEDCSNRASLDLRDVERLINLLRDVGGLINLLREAVAEQNRFAAKMKDMGVPPWAANGE